MDTVRKCSLLPLKSEENDIVSIPHAGGQSVPTFEYDLAPYVVKSFYKHFKDIWLVLIDCEAPNQALAIAKGIYERDGTLLDYDHLQELYYAILEDNDDYLIDSEDLHKVILTAYKLTCNETYQAMEAVIHNLNSMHSRAGAQVPFSGINYGTGTTAEQRLIIKNILLATDAGLGNGETPIFPVQIFKVKDSINTKPTDPNYDLFELACKVSAKRLFPNFSFIDSSFNLPYYKRNEPETEIAYMGCLSGSSAITVKDRLDRIHILSIKEFVEKENALDYKVYDSLSKSFVGIKAVINNPPSKDWYRVKFSDYSYVDVTSNHYFPIENKGRTLVTNLEVGDVIKTSDLSSLNDFMFYKEDMESWFKGLILTNGKYENSSIILTFNLESLLLAEKAQQYAEYFLGANTTLKEWHLKDKSFYELRIKGCKAYCKELISTFRGMLKNNRNLPEVFKSISHMYSFLAGMIDGSGVILTSSSGSVKCEFTLKNEALALQLFNMVSLLNLSPEIIRCDKKNKTEYILRFHTNLVLMKALKSEKLEEYSEKIIVPEYSSVTEIIPLNQEQKSYCLETESDRFDVNGICSHNCRTRVISNVNGPEIVSGRGNMSFTTVNLPMIALEANRDFTVFMSRLYEICHKVFKQLKDRYDLICQKHVYNFPFLLGQGVWLNSENLDNTDTLEEILKHSSLSLGFCGLAECLVALTGKHHGESKASQELGLLIISTMRQWCDEETERTHLNYSLFATPAESTAGTFLRKIRQKFGIVPGVSDHEYITNSVHVPVYYPITAAEKIRIEGAYHKYCNAGHICYVEMDGNLTKNIEAFKNIILYMKDCDIGYGSINHPVDRCPVCGYVGIINDVCPKCGRHDGEAVSIEKLKSLGCKCNN